ncbi:MAG: T9SS type A sorting domain-containing protein, partial [Saprospiraceae bacterium]
ILRNCNATTATNEPTTLESLGLQNFPNPFRDFTNIQFNLPQDAWVRLSIFDALGSELQVLFNKRLNGGEQQISFDGSRLASGTYFYRLQIDNQVKTKRMIKN